MFVLAFTYSNALNNQNTKNELLSNTKTEETSKKMLRNDVSPPLQSGITTTNSQPNISPFTLNLPSYADLVVSLDRPSCTKDPRLENLKKKESEKKELYNDQGPVRKPNIYKMMNNENFLPMSYLFDYLDEFVIKSQGKTFLSIVTEEFKKIYEASKAIPKNDIRFSDPYTPEKLLYYFSNGAAGVAPLTHSKVIKSTIENVKVFAPLKTDESFIFNMIRSFNKKFDEEIYKKGISPLQIFLLLNKWNWKGYQNNDITNAKKIVDEYDFDGDGALNPMEFILFSITHNFKEDNLCLQNCYREIFDKIIDPLFMYLDCDDDGYINSENIWNGLKNINRKSSNYDMYGCLFPLKIHKYYRTNSVNDFVLKNSHFKDSFINKEEFRYGLLIGFWERQTSNHEIYLNGDPSDKSKRWEENGARDIQCEKIKGFLP